MMRVFFVNRSPTQHASTIDYNRLRITQRLPVPPVMQPFFSSSSFGRRGSQGTRTPAPDALGSVARSLLPPPCKPWPPEDLSGRVQATARRRSQIPARRREGERPSSSTGLWDVGFVAWPVTRHGFLPISC